MKRIRNWTLGVVLCLCAATAAPAGPRFAIDAYRVEGNSLLPAAEIAAMLAPHTGPEADFARIQRAVERLQSAYADAGYSTVRVVLPEQDIDGGQVRIQVIEARIGKVLIEGAQHFDAANLRRSLPGLVEGQSPNMDRVGASLRVANENPAKQTSLVLRRGARDAEVDAVVRVADEAPMRLALAVDNTGTSSTGRARVGLIVQHANLFNLDHAASAQIITSPGHVGDVALFGLGYRIPLYANGDSLDFALGLSSVDSGRVSTAGGQLDISGQGYSASFRYHHNLARRGEWSQRLSAGLDRRLYRNQSIDPGSGSDLSPDLAVTPLILAYSLNGRSEDFEIGVNLSYVHNLPGGAYGRSGDFDQTGARPGARAAYRLWRYGASLARPLGDWLLKAEFAGQQSRDRLISGEQFGLGGADSIRGFADRDLANDRGERISLSLLGPDLGGATGIDRLSLRGLLFLDAGRLRRNDPLPGENAGEGVSSVGVGVRASLAGRASLRLDYAVVRDPGGSEVRGNRRLHASLTYLF